jgi:aspartyl-tRNA(Asn)/glutamyl-tRNA(Gln) amidotransferase subunit A
MQRAVSRVDAAHVDLPVPYMDLLAAVRTVNDYEGARTHEARWREHGIRIGRKLAELIERGLAIAAPSYRAALDFLTGTRLDALFERVDVLVMPAAPGPAPRGLESTGDPIMNAVWTGLGAPAISIPLPVAPGDLPLGLQMIAARGADGLLLTAASHVERSLAGWASAGSGA